MGTVPFSKKNRPHFKKRKEKNMKKQIPIFFTIDDEYAPYVACAITSIIQNSSREYDYKIYILHDGLNAENLTKLSKLKCEGFDIIFKEMKDGMRTSLMRILVK